MSASAPRFEDNELEALIHCINRVCDAALQTPDLDFGALKIKLRQEIQNRPFDPTCFSLPELEALIYCAGQTIGYGQQHAFRVPLDRMQHKLRLEIKRQQG